MTLIVTSLINDSVVVVARMKIVAKNMDAVVLVMVNKKMFVTSY